MLRLIAQKVSFIILVVITIIFFVHMGMRMVLLLVLAAVLGIPQG